MTCFLFKAVLFIFSMLQKLINKHQSFLNNYMRRNMTRLVHTHSLSRKLMLFVSYIFAFIVSIV